jgi:uncharacterized protein YciI
MTQYALIYKIVDMEKNTSNRPAHMEFLRGMLREGRIVDGYKFPDYGPGSVQAVVICEAKSKEEVAGWFQKDPIISSGARTFEVRDSERMAIKY